MKVNWYVPTRGPVTILNWAFQFDVGIFTEPILKTGDFPAEVRDTVLRRIPILSKQQRDNLKGYTTFTFFKYVTKYVGFLKVNDEGK